MLPSCAVQIQTQWKSEESKTRYRYRKTGSPDVWGRQTQAIPHLQALMDGVAFRQPSYDSE